MATSGSRGRGLRRALLLLGMVALGGAAMLGQTQWSGGQGARAQEVSGSTAAPQQPRQPVIVAEASEHSAAIEIRSVGTLASDESVLIASELPGRIAEILFDEGQAVHQGDVLLRLDDALAQVELTDAEAALTLAQANYERAARLAQSGTATQRALDEARAELARASAAVELIRVQLAKLSLTAPFDGVIGIRRVSLGAYITAGQALVNLEKIDRLKVDFKVPELFLSQIKVGQSVTVALDALPGRTFQAQIYTIDPLLDVNGRALNIRALLPNPALLLRPGLFARIVVLVDESRRVVMVPEEAILPRAGEQVVFRILDEVAEEVVVTLGSRRAGLVEVLEGLQAGDTVVTEGHTRLRDGTPVEILSSDDGSLTN